MVQLPVYHELWRAECACAYASGRSLVGKVVARSNDVTNVARARQSAYIEGGMKGVVQSIVLPAISHVSNF